MFIYDALMSSFPLSVIGMFASLFVVAADVAAGVNRMPCAEGRYLVQSGALVVGDAGAVRDTVTISPSTVSVASQCGSTPLRRSGRHLRAKWPLCLALGSEVRLRASVSADCQTMRGRVKVRRTKATQPFTARLSTCGDGFVDYGVGEECDDGNALGGDGCEPGCVVPPRDVTATITSASVTGQVLEQANVRVVLGRTGGRILFAVTVVSPRFSLCSHKWHLVQGATQVDLGSEPDATRGVARARYDEFSGCGIVTEGVTVTGAFESFPPGFDLGRPFTIVYDFSPIAPTCHNQGSACRIDVP